MSKYLYVIHLKIGVEQDDYTLHILPTSKFKYDFKALFRICNLFISKIYNTTEYRVFVENNNIYQTTLPIAFCFLNIDYKNLKPDFLGLFKLDKKLFEKQVNITLSNTFREYCKFKLE